MNVMTLKRWEAHPEDIPLTTSWYLADLGEAKGKQILFGKQSPQRLKALREHALIESSVSSNRIEGVEIAPQRIQPVILGQSRLRDRNEEEVRGYRDALKLIHESTNRLPISEKTILQFHRLIRGGVGDAGQYKERDNDITEKLADGRFRVRFVPTSAKETPGALKTLIEAWRQSLKERWTHPLIALAAFNLDFLCIHPFRDGNGRVSRLLLLLQSYHLGYDVGRYISLERHIEHEKERYYETLERCSKGWHQAKHDPWPYINFIHATLKTAYRELESRVGEVASPRGAKTEMVTDVIRRVSGSFDTALLQRECPGVSVDMVRQILKNFRTAGRVKCLGYGRNARWEKTARWGK